MQHRKQGVGAHTARDQRHSQGSMCRQERYTHVEKTARIGRQEPLWQDHHTHQEWGIVILGAMHREWERGPRHACQGV